MSEKFTVRTGRMDDAAEMARIYDYYVAGSDVIFSNILLSADDMRAKMERMDIGTFSFPDSRSRWPGGRICICPSLAA